MILKIFVMIALLYGALFLGAHAFEFLAFRISGIQASDLDPETYRTPDPDPATNFYSVLEYDFSSSSKDNYSPRGLHDYYPIPGVHGRSSDGNFLPWPWDPDFSLFYDPQTVVDDGLERIQQRGGNLPGKVTDAKSISSAKTPLEACEALISPFRPFIQRLCSGLDRPESINPLPYPKPFSPETPQLSVIDLIRVAKLMNLESLLGLAQEPPKMEAEPILVNLRLAQGMLDRPIGVLGQIGGLAITGITLPVIWKGCEESALTTEELIRIQNQLTKLNPVRDCLPAIMASYSFQYQAVLSGGVLAEVYQVPKILLPILAPILRGLLFLEVEKTRSVIGRGKRFMDEKDHFPFLEKLLWFWHIHWQGTFRSLQVYNDCVKTDLHVKLSRLDLAVELFKRKTGKVPESLGQLVPTVCQELPVDPLTGKAFGYKKTGPNEYVLYSWWVDQKDDGGTPVSFPPMNPEKGEENYKFMMDEAKGDLVWPRHRAGGN